MSDIRVTFTGSRRPIAPLNLATYEGVFELRKAIHAHVWPAFLGADLEVLLNEFSGSGRVVNGSRTVALFTVDPSIVDGAA